MGTLYALKGYEKLRTLTPDALCANAAFAAFDAETWQEELRRYLGSAAQGMIENVKNSVRYDAGKHAARLHNLVSRWPEILRIIDEELPAYEAVLSLLRRIGAPTVPADFGLDNADAPKVFAMTRDIRDKYILSTLAFDLGILDTIAAQMTPPAQQ